MITVERLTIADGALEPVTASDVMTFGRITDPADVPLVEALITAAREELERLTGRIVVAGTFAILADAWVPVRDLPLAPITSIDLVEWVGVGDVVPPDPPVALSALDALRAPVTYLAGGDPVVGVGAEVSRDHGDGFIRNVRTARSSVGAALYSGSAPLALRIEVSAGYASGLVPAGIVHYVRTLALLRYTHRDDPDALARAQAFAGAAVNSFGVVQA